MPTKSRSVLVVSVIMEYMSISKKLFFSRAVGILTAVVVLVLTLPVGVSAQSSINPTPTPSMFRFYKDVEPNVEVPTVVQLPVNKRLGRHSVIVYDKQEKSYIPALYHVVSSESSVRMRAQAQPDQGYASDLLDDDITTYAQFNVSKEQTREHQANISVIAERFISSSKIELVLADHVALPNSVEVLAKVDGQWQIVVSERNVHEHTISFPETTSDKWRVSFNYSQPLRISELRVIQEDVERTTKRGIRFLARPGHNYRVYYGADRSHRIPVGERPNLWDNKGVQMLENIPRKSNPLYQKADTDNDDVADIMDNCVSVSNPEQIDKNNNGRGDACDDFDKDGVINKEDNCPDKPNSRQIDTDGDGVGDVCDEEESRITEKYPWLPWGALGIAALVLVFLIIMTVRYSNEDGEDGDNSDNPTGFDSITDDVHLPEDNDVSCNDEDSAVRRESKDM